MYSGYDGGSILYCTVPVAPFHRRPPLLCEATGPEKVAAHKKNKLLLTKVMRSWLEMSSYLWAGGKGTTVLLPPLVPVDASVVDNNLPEMKALLSLNYPSNKTFPQFLGHNCSRKKRDFAKFAGIVSRDGLGFCWPRPKQGLLCFWEKIKKYKCKKSGILTQAEISPKKKSPCMSPKVHPYNDTNPLFSFLEKSMSFILLLVNQLLNIYILAWLII